MIARGIGSYNGNVPIDSNLFHAVWLSSVQAAVEMCARRCYPPPNCQVTDVIVKGGLGLKTARAYFNEWSDDRDGINPFGPLSHFSLELLFQTGPQGIAKMP